MKQAASKEQETWKDVAKYEGYFQVSDIGRIRSLDRVIVYKDGRRRFEKGKIIQLKRPAKNGYYLIDLWKDGEVCYVYLHRLVLETFIGPGPLGQEARHLDGVRTNNKLSNLCWGTRSENAKDSVRHGTNPIASRSFEERSIVSKKVQTASWAKLSKEERAARMCRVRAGIKMTREQMTILSQQAILAKTPEQRSESTKKGWITRRRNKNKET